MRREATEPGVLHIDEQNGWRGGEQQMLYLARGLRERSIRTGAVLQPASPAVDRTRRAGIDVHEVRMRGEMDLTAAWRIARTAQRGGFNILHSHTAHAQALAQLAKCICGARCKVVAHRRIEFPVGRALLGLGKVKYRLGVQAYIAISNRVKETLMEAGVPEWRVFVVHSVTDPERFLNATPDPELRANLGIPEDAFVVGNIAALVGHKDHRTLLEASRIVRDQIPETWVVIVGQGPMRDQVRSKARSLHMDERVILTGFREDIPQFIRMFDVFALSSSEEGLCSTLLEVAAGGCPIVATDAGGVREAVLPEETGIIVPVRSPRALAQGILRLAEHPMEARRFAERGRQRVIEHFNPEVLTRRTLEVYRRVLANDVRPDRPVGFCED
ncbi:MAG: glycosyltransferase [Candidatus Brocadiaceae bacterium]|jgi:glycosyltransferase involved in cell wall biosynthesis